MTIIRSNGTTVGIHAQDSGDYVAIYALVQDAVTGQNATGPHSSRCGNGMLRSSRPDLPDCIVEAPYMPQVPSGDPIKVALFVTQQYLPCSLQKPGLGCSQLLAPPSPAFTIGGVSEVAELVTMLFGPFDSQGGFSQMNPFRSYRARYSDTIGFMFIILIMGALPMVRAYGNGPVRSSVGFAKTTGVPGRSQPVPLNYSGPAYTAVFHRTGCGNLGNNIQARFEWDISGGTNNSNTMTIKEFVLNARKSA